MEPMYAAGNVAIAICDRCGFKFPHNKLRPDGNSPGLFVCDSDWDPRNPWRDPPIQPDAIAMRWSRPDVALVPGNIIYPDLTNPVNPIPAAGTPAGFLQLEGGFGEFSLEGDQGFIDLESGP
jgi:hypothetical protein